jgi:sugar phosphate isomerase/epimerase
MKVTTNYTNWRRNMKLGLLTGVIGNHSRGEAFDIAQQLGLDAVELGTGEFASDWHVGLDDLLSTPSAVEALKHDLSSRGLELSALSCHSNPLHPNPAYAQRAQDVVRKTVLAAEMLGVERICLFAGCPGTPDGGEYPNWVSTGWPTYFTELLEWQWAEKVVPFWKEHAAFAAEHHVKLAFEMHPGDCVFNMQTLLRLREACGSNVGANFDPSHLWWQLSDPLVVARELGERGMLYHVHAKDTYIDLGRTAVDGVLATTPQEDPGRSWRFATVGYGHDAVFWKELASTLRVVGYEGVLSIEHEDPLAPVMEGLERTVKLLRDALWSEPSASLSWLTDPPNLTTLELQGKTR